MEADAGILDPIAAAGLVGRWLTFAAIMLVVGAVIFRYAVVARAGLSRAVTDALAERAARVGTVGATLILPAGLLRLFVETAGMRFPDDPWMSVAWRLITMTPWGHLWIAQMLIAVLLMPSFRMAKSDRAAWALGLFALMLAVTPSLSSHAMSGHANRIVTLSSDAFHVIGASAWIGTMALLLLALRLDVTDTHVTAALLSRFSPIALFGSAVVVTSGVISSLAHVDRISALTGTTYGRLLIVKICVVGAVVLLGWRNWRRLTPGLEAAGPSTLRRSIAMELLVAALVLAITAALVVTPLPMQGM